MLRRLSSAERTVGELAEPFDMSFAAAAKHVKVLEMAGLLSRTVEGRMNRCRMEARPLARPTAGSPITSTAGPGASTRSKAPCCGVPADEEEEPQMTDTDFGRVTAPAEVRFERVLPDRSRRCGNSWPDSAANGWRADRWN